jgi:hypothetical protein
MDLKQIVEKLSTDECKELLGLLQFEINVPKNLFVMEGTG